MLTAIAVFLGMLASKSLGLQVISPPQVLPLAVLLGIPGGSVIIALELLVFQPYLPGPSTCFAANGRKTDAYTLDSIYRTERNCRHHFRVAVLAIWFGGCHAVPLFCRYHIARYFTNGHAISEKRRWRSGLKNLFICIYYFLRPCFSGKERLDRFQPFIIQLICFAVNFLIVVAGILILEVKRLPKLE